MFQKQTVKVFSIIALVLSIVGILLSVASALLIEGQGFNFPIIIAIVSWAILLWSSIIAFQLCSKYKNKLQEEEYKKIGYRVYAIVVAFILFFFIGITFGLVISIAIFVTLWALKSNIDDWERNGGDAFLEVDTNEKQ